METTVVANENKDVLGGTSTSTLLTNGTQWVVRTIIRFWSGNYYSTLDYEGTDEKKARNTYACVKS